MDNRWTFKDPQLQDFVREVCNALETIQTGGVEVGGEYNPLLLVEKLKMKDLDATPVGNILLKVLDQVLYFKDSGDTNAIKIITYLIDEVAGTFDGVDVSALKSDVDGFPDELKNLSTAEIDYLEALYATGVTSTEYDYLDGVTSAIQTQLGLKAPLASPTFTGAVTIPSTADDGTYTGIVTNDSGVLKYRTKAQILGDIGAIEDTTDIIKNTHIDWGSGVGQVDADDVPESATRKWAGETGATQDQTGVEIVALLEALVGVAKLSHDSGLSDISSDDHHAQLHYHDTETLQLDGVNSDGGAFSFNTTGTVTHNQTLAITKASALLIDLNPGFTGTGNVIEITPSAAIGTEDAVWCGLNIDGSALDPSEAGVFIEGANIDLSGVSLANSPHLDGLDIIMPAGIGHHALHLYGEYHQDLDFTSAVAGETYTGNDIIVETATSTGGIAHIMDVARGGAGSVDITALGTHEGISVIRQEIGTFAAFDKVFEYDNDGPGWTDVTAGNAAVWDDKDDIVYFGHGSTFSEIQLILTTPATKDMFFTFAYSVGGSSYTPFSPADDTEGGRQNGTIRFEASDLAGWATDTVNSVASKYWIRVTRNRTSGTGPTVTTFKQLAPTNYTWNASGDVSIHDLDVLGEIDPTSYVTGRGGFKDEDDMASDSATAVASQQSIKKYVDDDANVIRDNISINAIRTGIENTLSIFKIRDGIVDVFTDETGIDTANCINQSYNAAGDYYEPTETQIVGDLLSEDCDNFTDADPDWVDADAGGGASTIEAGVIGGVTGGMFKLLGGAAGANQASRTWTRAGGIPDNFTVEIKIYCDAIGTRANNDYLFFSIQNGVIDFRAGFASDGLFTHDGAQWNEVGTDLVVQDTWQTWRFVVTGGVAGTATFDVYLNRVLQVSDVDCSKASAVEGLIDITQYTITTANRLSYIDYIEISDGLITTFEYDNMTLISESVEAEAEPSEARLLFLMEDVDAATVNTDILGYSSLDDGSNWETITLVDVGDFSATQKIIAASKTLTDRNDQTMVYKIVTANNKQIKIHATTHGWKPQ